MAKMALKKLKGKMPSAPGKEDSADPMFDIPEGEDEHESPQASEGGAPDTDADERTAARAKDGTLSSEGEMEEGTPEHEAAEGPAEKEAEGEGTEKDPDYHADKLADCSDEDLIAELHRRQEAKKKSPGKPADKGDSHESAEDSDEDGGSFSY